MKPIRLRLGGSQTLNHINTIEMKNYLLFGTISHLLMALELSIAIMLKSVVEALNNFRLWIVNSRYLRNRLTGMPTIGGSANLNIAPLVKGWMYKMFARLRSDEVSFA